MGKSITDLSSVTTVGLSLARHVFNSTALILLGGLELPKRPDATSCWSFSLRCRLRGARGFWVGASLGARADHTRP